ncbi:MAG: MerC domain-containing protein [Verrucomicrobia bacterium]|nr:MerC domain-containing protein [Verrucomicrobiota bacterium]
MITVEFIYDLDCPNVTLARTNLLKAFSKAGLPAKWMEWDRSAPDGPKHVRHFGSPAILVNGSEITGLPPNPNACCRIYYSADGKPGGVPSVELITASLMQEANREKPVAAIDPAAPPTTRWKQFSIFVPTIGVALLPKLSCPACWPAYAGILSALGLGFLISERYLLSLTALFVAVSLFALSWRAKKRRGYGPFILGLLAAVTVLTGKFYFDFAPALYGGVALLVGASVWNTWPTKKQISLSCLDCAGVEENQPKSATGAK